MKISILTISYNQDKYLEETINSILNQSYNNFEYIVVDAGSTDGSREIIEKYRNRISKIIFESDDGPADGLNKGFLAATGDILGFVNSDDLLLPNAIEKIAEAFDKYKEADVIYGHGYFIDKNNNILRKIYSDKFNIKRYLYGCVTIIQPSLFFKKESFKKINGFNKGNKTCWDGELITDFALSKLNFKLIDEFLSSFRLHNEGSSGMGKKNPKYRLWKEDKKRLFRKIKGRNKNIFDLFPEMYYRIQKWRYNSRNISEYLRFQYKKTQL